LKQLVDAHDDFGGIVLAVEEVPRERVSSYGIIDPGETTGNRLEIRGMVEKPSADEAPSNLCITGRYILSTEIFDFLDKGVRGAGGEIQLTDAIADNLGKMPIHGVRFSGRRFDCGSKEGFVAANLHFGLKHPEIADKVKRTATEIMQQQG
ncbi:MAG: sugar phosphate nucleotidyltransferase, partial [Pseudomonadota bacterium]|nr:sugar phosphate nucleotidyltransferase [Pseudomonadota bacterium]